MISTAFKRKEVANLFGVNILTVRTWEKKKIITPSFYVGIHPRYSIEEVEKVATTKPTVIIKEKTPGNE